MTVSNETINTIAELSRLEFDAITKEQFGKEFDRIVEYFNAIESLNLEGVEPLKTILDADVNVFREDEVGGEVPTSVALSNAPKHNNVFFKVPKVIDHG